MGTDDHEREGHCLGCAAVGCSKGSAQAAMRKVAEIIAVATFVGMVVAIPLYSWDLARHGTQQHLIAWFSAGAFTLITFPISMHGIINHMTHWYMPGVQKYVVRILWMVPLYSVESWLSLRFHKVALYIETVRDMYEAYVIYSFLYYLVELLGGEGRILDILETSKGASATRHVWPLNYLLNRREGPRSGGGRHHSPRRRRRRAGHGADPEDTGEGLIGPTAAERDGRADKGFLYVCKLGCLQYVVIKVILAAVTCAWGGYEPNFRFSSGFLYITILSNFSQTWALYCMVMFYSCFKEELTKWRPVGKFLSVKAVVFFTWWQSLCIEILRANGFIASRDVGSGWTSADIANGLQDWLICVEMLGAALAHRWSFTHLDYMPEAADADREPFLSAFLDATVPNDIFLDIKRAAQGRLTGPRYSAVEEEEEDDDDDNGSGDVDGDLEEGAGAGGMREMTPLPGPRAGVLLEVEGGAGGGGGGGGGGGASGGGASGGGSEDPRDIPHLRPSGGTVGPRRNHLHGV